MKGGRKRKNYNYYCGTNFVTGWYEFNIVQYGSRNNAVSLKQKPGICMCANIKSLSCQIS
jgi:hypothetical protein